MSLQKEYKILNGEEPEKIDEEIELFSYRVVISGEQYSKEEVERYLKGLKNQVSGINLVNVMKI